MPIEIKIAFCTQCNGYHSATPSDKKDSNNTDIIDHFFYHGEPWFTLDPTTFEKASKLEKTEVKTMSFDEHIKNDHLYCHCSKKRASVKENHNYESVNSISQSVATAEKYVDADFYFKDDYYFKDLYYTYNNFHGLSSNGNGKSHVNFGR